MIVTSTKTSIHINASVEDVFSYVTDLTRHGEWAANPLTVEAVSEEPISIGSEYRSHTRVMGKNVSAILRVTEYEPNSRFSFTVDDSSGHHVHEFTFRWLIGGTLMERKTSHDMSLVSGLMFQAFGWRFIGKPGMEQAYHSLKEHLEDNAA